MIDKIYHSFDQIFRSILNSKIMKIFRDQIVFYCSFIIIFLSLDQHLYGFTGVIPEEFYNSLITTSFRPDSSFTVKDDKFGTSQWSTIDTILRVRDAVIFDLNDDTNYIYKYPFSCNVKVKINCWDKFGTLTTMIKSFNINYDTGYVKKYNTRNVFYFSNAHKIKVTIQTINFTQTGWDGNLPKTLRLSGFISVERKYKYSCTSKAFPKAQIQSPKNTLKISWNAIAGAEEYDLEWTYYHDSSSVIKKYLSSSTTKFKNYDSIYRNNSTRITTIANVYYIPMSYPSGWIFFRVRGVHYSLDSTRITGPWNGQDSSYKFSLYPYRYKTFGMDTSLNWQSKVTYAEEGKRSPVISYFDGSLRSRQTVTVSEAISKAIVGETFYDHQGRSAAQSLPAPAPDALLGFHDMFNKDTLGAQYNRDDFDLYACSFSPPRMDSTTGAAKYYSKNNPDYTKLIHKYLPAAEGYPFSVTRYTSDLTGRVATQSLPGKVLRTGNGHETKYYYGKPSQEELDRLFGNDVGYDSLYFKNMVVDPNGQVTLSYLDGAGHTIATALAGDSPSNLNALPSNTGATTINIDLLTSNNTSGSSLSMDYSLLIDKQGNYKFSYSLVPGNFSTECVSTCYDCLYDLTIRISDVCNNSSLPGDTAFQHVLHNYSLGAIYDTLCTPGAAQITDTFTLNLGIGEYHISKTLSVSDAAKDQYVSSYLRHDECIKTFDEFLSSATDSIDFSGCYMNCQDCINGIGTSADFLTNYINKLGYSPSHQDTLDANQLYENALASCNHLCDTVPNECEMVHALMRSDMTPGGQYAKYQYNSSTNQFSSYGDTSILNTTLPSGFFGGKSYTEVKYCDAYGNPDTVWIDGYPYKPAELSVDEFIRNWRDSWADSLATLHPEYCYYKFCNSSKYRNAYRYQARMLNTNTYSDAISNGFLNPLDKSNATALNTNIYSGGSSTQDYFTSSSVQEDSLFFYPFPNYSTNYNSMNDSMHYVHGTFMTDWEIASIAANTITSSPTHVPGFEDSCDANANIAWFIFRGNYLGEREKFLENAFVNSEYNGCYSTMTQIGTSSSLYYSHMKRRVFFYDDLINETSNASTTESDMISSCEANCENMAHTWLIQLMALCTISPGDTGDIKEGFIAVCQGACDDQHPLGATSLPIGTSVHPPDNYTSFQDVLNKQMSSGSCDASAIAFPPPYSLSSPSTQNTFGDLDTCVCHRLETIRSTEYIDSAHSGNISFAQYLDNNYESNLTEAQVYNILGVCEGKCSWLSGPITLPSMLSCGGCVTCYNIRHDLALLEGEALDSTAIAIQLNSQYGFNYYYGNYRAFWTNCKNNYSGIVCRGAACDTIYPYSIQLCKSDTVYAYSDTVSCFDQLMNEALATATQDYNEYIDSLKGSIWDDYKSYCINAAEETFDLNKIYDQYHFTLYYYDEAGNLVQTVPPAGVVPLTSTSDLNAVKTYRATHSGSPKIPSHTLYTRYWYNTLNKPVKQWTPDADTTRFWYDRLGRIVVSQNANQRSSNQYSYTLYDALGRIVETGQLKQTTALTFAIALSPSALSSWLAAGTSKRDVTHTYYEKAAFSIPGLTQENLRNRIASITFESTGDADSLTYDFASHYSYDVAGNVKTLVQENRKLTSNKNRYKRICYDYDLVSNKVNKVYYEKDSLDQFTHQYYYDDDNRLNVVKSSSDNLLYYIEANYLYYNHGPLARLELGARQVQGVDYAYTLQGWVKGVNSDYLSPSYDMGMDGLTATHKFFGKDVLGFSFSYYDKDYRPIGTSKFEATYGASGFGGSSPSLFNGNIRRATYALKGMVDSTIGYAYRYDQLNRLVSMNAWRNFSYSTFTWPSSGSASKKWKEGVTYDPNGNILTYIRHGDSPTLMDSLTYNYQSGTNKLRWVDDGVSSSNYSTDLDDQSTNNYGYDNVGNLKSDVSEQISLIKWTVANKIDSIARSGGTKDKLKFYYDATGNRVGKMDYKNSGATIKTWYVRDAQGNIMAAYTQSHDTVTWSEQDLYGSSRVGYWLPNKRVYPGVSLITTDTFHLTFCAGDRRYELTNHLGNVMAVITDRKIGIDTNANSKADFYRADTISVQDYYPFGMLMPDRNLSYENCRFGFNNKEDDNEVYGNDNFQDYGMRMYNPRLGRFITVDPLTSKYPWFSPYQFAGNTPIQAIDLDGAEQAYKTSGGTWVEARDGVLQRPTTDQSAIDYFAKRSEDVVHTPSAFEQAEFDLVYPLAESINTLFTGRNSQNQKAGFSDYVSAAGTIFLFGITGEDGDAGISPDNLPETSPLEDANWAQNNYKETFQNIDDVPDFLRGRTIDEVVADIKSGKINPKSLEVQYAKIDGQTLIVNTRTSEALTRAGIPRSEWTAKDVTNISSAVDRLKTQLNNSKLTSKGATQIKSRETGKVTTKQKQ